MMVLWLLILRGVSIEFRGHVESPLWRPFWDLVFGGSSALLALLFGAALGNVVRSVPLDSEKVFFLPLWTNFQPGKNAGLVDWHTLSIGAASFVALTVHGCYWVASRTEGDLRQRARWERKAGGPCWRSRRSSRSRVFAFSRIWLGNIRRIRGAMCFRCWRCWGWRA